MRTQERQGDRGAVRPGRQPDPFAPPVWRSPVHRTPERSSASCSSFGCSAGDLVRGLPSAARRGGGAGHPRLAQSRLARPGGPGRARPGGAHALRLAWPGLFARLVTAPVRDGRRHWYYRRRWHAVMTITGLAPPYRGRVLVPVLADVQAGGPVDRVTVHLVSGQAPATLPPGPKASRTASASTCAGSARPRPAWLCWSCCAGTHWPTWSRRCPSRHGWIWRRCRSAGARTGHRGCCGCSARTSWSRAPRSGQGFGAVVGAAGAAARHCGRLGAGVGVDPKRMELSFGRALFARYADQAAAMVELLEAAVAEMHDRAAELWREDAGVRGVGGFPVPGGPD